MFHIVRLSEGRVLQWLRSVTGSWASSPSKEDTLTQKQSQWHFPFSCRKSPVPLNSFSTAGREVSGTRQNKVCTSAFPLSCLVAKQLLIPLRESPEPENRKPPSVPITTNSLPPTYSSYTAIITTVVLFLLKSRNSTFSDSK